MWLVRENRICVCAFLVEIQLIMVFFCFRLSMAGSMCMKGAVCETSSVGVKTCVASTVTSTMSAADGGAKLTFVLVALAASMLA